MTAVDLYNSLNVFEKQKFCEMFAKHVTDKFDQELIKQRREQEIFNEGYETGFRKGIDVAVAINADMYWNHWIVTLKKAERLKNMYKLFLDKLSDIGNVTDKKRKAREELERQTGERLQEVKANEVV